MSVKVIVRANPAHLIPEIQWHPGIVAPGILEALRLLLHLLKPASMAFFLLAAWRFFADLGWTAEFMIPDGILSHWQVWLAFGFATIGIQSEFEKLDHSSQTPSKV